MNQPKYRFYATLLDAFAWYQVSESENAEQELLDKINRVPITDEKALERVNRGKELNDLVDGILRGEIELTDETVSFNYGGFEFRATVIRELVQYLSGAVIQHRTSTIIIANGVAVEVYGVADYIKQNKCIDLKTTSGYDLGKYKDSMQRHLYPVCLYNEGIAIDEFEFLITDFNSVFKEPYQVDTIQSNSILATQCAMLIEFIESRKHLITDTKIFVEQINQPLEAVES